ncbi:MFS transporter [Dactylosporangium vinaceum]|uniref:MFS transporter n=1 Tax=Dactylosporangium vinaceum TaxID=53362 RepID=A0ABV5MD45_9ACTN|nr:MFS transporter [Dactylosporangium vinaceum]UAC00828.1 MFS transporter [Dactylosporangium vinaceum]
MAAEATTTVPAGIVRRYAAAVGTREVRAAFVWSVVSRLPLMLISLGLTLFVLRDGTYQQAGTVVGVFTAGVAVVGLPVGRLIDRTGQTAVLLVTGVVFPVLVVVFVSTFDRLGPWALPLIFAAGGSRPPVSPAIRALWGSVVADGEARLRAFGLEAILAEFFSVSGPLLLSLGLLVATPAVALSVGAVVVGAGAVGLATTKVSRTWSGAAPGAGRAPRSGPMRSRPFRLLLAALAPGAMAIGMVNIAIPVFADRRGGPVLAGVLFAVWCAGSILGGVWYGRRDRSRLAGRQFLILMGLFAAGTALPILAGDPWSLGLALAVGGTVIAPVTTVEYLLVRDLVAADGLAEGFSWVATLNVLATAAGSQLAGLLLADLSPRAVFTAAALVALSSLVPAALLARALTGRARPTGER